MRDTTIARRALLALAAGIAICFLARRSGGVARASGARAGRNADAAQAQTQAAHDSARCRAWRRRSRRDQPARGQGKNRNAGDGARAGTPAQGVGPVSRRADPAPGCPRAAARARRAGAPPPGRAAAVDPCRRAARSGHPRPVGLYAVRARPPTARRRSWPRAKTRTISSSGSRFRSSRPSSARSCSISRAGRPTTARWRWRARSSRRPAARSGCCRSRTARPVLPC